MHKPEPMQWIGRPVGFADLNGDGRMDVFGGLIHNDGHLPRDKASVFGVQNTGPDPRSWLFHPVKHSDGANTRHQWKGEKWDHLFARDLDRDGDLDLVGNVEEHYRMVEGRNRSWFAVVWSENPSR